jgi:hypothetical protein
MALIRDGKFSYKGSNLETGLKSYLCPISSTSNYTEPNNCFSHSPKYGIFGWNAKYPILYPTNKTLGGWDYFSKNFIHESEVACHAPIESTEGYYETERYPEYGVPSQPVTSTFSPNDKGPSLITGSHGEVYQGLSK